jgi:outer membrane lipoprotein-sorting protein
MKWCRVIVLCGMMWMGWRAQAAERPAGVDEKLWGQLVEIDARGAKVEDLTAKFEQRKFTPLLKKPLVSSGTLTVKGAAMLWRTEKPEPTIMRIDAKEAQLYYPKQKVVEVYPIGQKLGALAASPLPRLGVLKEHFKIEQVPMKEDVAGQMLLKLTPTNAELRQHVEQVVVLLDVNSGLMLRAETTDADGDRTVLTFTESRVNGGVREEDVRLQIPSGVKVVRPLEGTSGVQESK